MSVKVPASSAPESPAAAPPPTAGPKKSVAQKFAAAVKEQQAASAAKEPVVATRRAKSSMSFLPPGCFVSSHAAETVFFPKSPLQDEQEEKTEPPQQAVKKPGRIKSSVFAAGSLSFDPAMLLGGKPKKPQAAAASDESLPSAATDEDGKLQLLNAPATLGDEGMSGAKKKALLRRPGARAPPARRRDSGADAAIEADSGVEGDSLGDAGADANVKASTETPEVVSAAVQQSTDHDQQSAGEFAPAQSVPVPAPASPVLDPSRRVALPTASPTSSAADSIFGVSNDIFSAPPIQVYTYTLVAMNHCCTHSQRSLQVKQDFVSIW